MRRSTDGADLQPAFQAAVDASFAIGLIQFDPFVRPIALFWNPALLTPAPARAIL